ncbi:hypothetical protein EVA_06547 [gut metagenome]|uniref:Uncharacterized protein n=1 Tax=gut metagenome TaxID=749906 RepID=J9GXA1_9ZZZZ
MPDEGEKTGSGNCFLRSRIAAGIKAACTLCSEVKEQQTVWKDKRMYMSWFRRD